MEYEQKIFSKIERPGFEGVDGLRHFTKMMLFLEILSITVRKISFLEYIIFRKSVKKWQNALDF